MALLKQATAYTRTFLMVQSSDHVTGLTGATVSVALSKAGAAFAAAGGTVSEIGNGFYKVALTTADTGTLGDLAFHCTATGADPTDFVDQVAANILGDTLPANVVTYAAGEDPATLVLDAADGIEAGITVREALRYLAAALAGVLSGAATTTVTISAIGNAATPRISATVDANGNRSAVTLS